MDAQLIATIDDAADVAPYSNAGILVHVESKSGASILYTLTSPILRLSMLIHGALRCRNLQLNNVRGISTLEAT
jgi:hypothetical protein